MQTQTPSPMATEDARRAQASQTADEEILRRLRWRARRGLLENDLLLERFFASWEGRLTLQDHEGLARLFDLADNDLLDLLIGRAEPQAELDHPEVHSVLQKIRAEPLK